jgi:ribosomal protein L11 methyltransferase
MPWVVLHIASNRENNATLEQALLDEGAAAVTLEDAADQALFEPDPGETPLWRDIRLSGLFDAGVNIEAIVDRLLASQASITRSACRIEILEDKDWVRSWMDDYQAIRIGQRLWICPSWKSPPDPQAVNLQLDPGMAFGTGTHPTTALCLAWLDAHHWAGQHVIDYGCGSGILAIAALLLGAESATGVDIDPQSLITARDNANRNGLTAQQLPLYLPGQLPEPVAADTVLANILAGPLVALSPTLSRLVKPHGHLLLSGILQDQVPGIVECYPCFDFAPPQIDEEWALLVGVKKAD